MLVYEHSRVMVILALFTLLLSAGCDRQIDDLAAAAIPSVISLPIEPSIHPSLIPSISTSTPPSAYPNQYRQPARAHHHHESN